MDVPNEFEELDKITTIDNVTITSYHALQDSAINEEYDRDKFDLDLYDYIVSDEIHFIMTDSSFNTLNRFTYEKLVATRHMQAIKIFMSATMEEIKEPIIKCANKVIGKKPTIHEFTTGIDYSYVKPIYFESNGYIETLVNLIKNDISEDKWLIFITEPWDQKRIRGKNHSCFCFFSRYARKKQKTSTILLLRFLYPQFIHISIL